MRKHLLLAVVTLALLVVFTGLNVQATDPGTDYHPVIDTFFQKVQEGEGEEAIEYIFATNPWIDPQSDAVVNLKSQFTQLPDLVGQYNDHQLLVEKVVAERFAYVAYFVAYDRQPIRFEFEFYKSKEEWLGYSFSFDAELDTEIENSGRQEALRSQ